MSIPLQQAIPLDEDLTERAVVIVTADGSLYGNAVLPTSAGRTGIVAVHGWSGYRHGPHGLLTYLCRQLASSGCPTLRFDFRGRGESGGNGLESSLPSMADDLVAASEWFAREYDLQHIVYLGICSGGNVAVGSLGRLPRACGLILFSVYPFSDGDAFGRDLNRTWHYARIYAHKAMQRETWSRLFKGDIHLKQVGNVLFGHLLRRRRNQKKEQAPQQSAAPGSTAKPTADESRNQAEKAPKKHLANLTEKTPALMIYGSADPDAQAAKAYYGGYAEDKKLPISFVDIEGANHNFSSIEWKNELARLANDFIARLKP